MTDVLNVGDFVRVTNPDPDYGCACILASTGRAFRVVRVHGTWVDVETGGLYLVPTTVPLDMEEVTKCESNI